MELVEPVSKDLALEKLSILSPTKDEINRGIFSSRSTLSFESMRSELSLEAKNDWKAQVNPSELVDYVVKVNKKLTKIKDSWSKPFLDIDARFCAALKSYASIFRGSPGHFRRRFAIQGQRVFGWSFTIPANDRFYRCGSFARMSSMSVLCRWKGFSIHIMNASS